MSEPKVSSPPPGFGDDEISREIKRQAEFVAPEMVKALRERAEVAEVALARLVGLIAAMGHEDFCRYRGLIACRRAVGEQCEWKFSGCTTHVQSKFSCNCIKGKVNA